MNIKRLFALTISLIAGALSGYKVFLYIAPKSGSLLFSQYCVSIAIGIAVAFFFLFMFVYALPLTWEWLNEN